MFKRISNIFYTTREVIIKIDDFFNLVDKGILIFRNGIENYLDSDNEMFTNNLHSLTQYEQQADILRRDVENELYLHSLLPEYRSDVLRIIEKTDDILDTAKYSLNTFELESPFIPECLKNDIRKLTEMSVKSAEELVQAAKSYFRDVRTVRDKVHRVYFFEKESDKISSIINRKIFKEIPDLHLSQKNHLRYFVTNIESISNCAEEIADILSISAIKRIV